MATRAEIIDDFFKEQDAFSHVPYQPLGRELVQECESMGPDGLFVSTAAALVEKESGGKNIFGCDFGERWITDPHIIEKPNLPLGRPGHARKAAVWIAFLAS